MIAKYSILSEITNAYFLEWFFQYGTTRVQENLYPLTKLATLGPSISRVQIRLGVELYSSLSVKVHKSPVVLGRA